MPKVAVFIDGSNLFYACKIFSKDYEVDLVKLRDLLAGDRELLRAYFYGSFNPRKQDQIKFHHFLQENGFTVRVTPLRQRGDRLIEKGADVRLVTDMLALGLRGTFDTAVLVSGDSDFIDAVEEIKRAGIRVEIAMFEGAISSELRRRADKFISLDKIANEIKR